jgi:hypothetical protein
VPDVVEKARSFVTDMCWTPKINDGQFEMLPIVKRACRSGTCMPDTFL